MKKRKRRRKPEAIPKETIETPGLRDTIIELLSQPLALGCPVNMDAVRKWKEMVAGQILEMVTREGTTRFKCDCGKLFKTSQGLGAHRYLTHELTSPYRHTK